MSSHVPTVGVIANPLSGRDVRRVAARGAIATNQDKRNRIARSIIGAVTAGARRIVVMDEPFRIASGAIADLKLDVEMDTLDIGAKLTPDDTVRAAEAMRDMGVDVLIVLGGDGTNRTIATVWPDVTLVPMSTGTNNVFPTGVEPTIAGAAAGLVASGKVDAGVAPQSKVVRIEVDGERDIALIDAVHLVGDFVGNRMPYEPSTIRTLVLSRAEPSAIGVSAIGGLVRPCDGTSDMGVVVECGPGGRPLRAPVAPGLYRTVPVISSRTVELGEEVDIMAPGLLAYDGDRTHRVRDCAKLTIVRNGPRVVDVEAALSQAAASGLFMTDDSISGDSPLL
ncbi:MAG: ATP-NAD kinase [Actinomycetia bacterium]|nr:ATP-NAD kinase [Actinomycetes bacterium]MCP4960976.1 ATP-NAD kinase [Actinomycetes bacterium]